MRNKLISIALVVLLAGASLAAVGWLSHTHSHRAAVRAAEVVRVRHEAPRVYEGRIRDARPGWGYLILTAGEGKQAQDFTFDIRGARIVGRSGNEWKVGDLWVGDRVRVELTPDRRLVQQITVLAD
jgi:hypothetical protein